MMKLLKYRMCHFRKEGTLQCIIKGEHKIIFPCIAYRVFNKKYCKQIMIKSHIQGFCWARRNVGRDRFIPLYRSLIFCIHRSFVYNPPFIKVRHCSPLSPLPTSLPHLRHCEIQALVCTHPPTIVITHLLACSYSRSLAHSLSPTFSSEGDACTLSRLAHTFK